MKESQQEVAPTRSVRIDLPGREYDVVIGQGILSQLGSRLRNLCPHEKCALIADEKVYAHFGDSVVTSLNTSSWKVARHVGSLVESRKNLDTVREIYDVLLNNKLERKSPVIALGGGVCGDTAGFVAASYLRGVPFIQCPTTLLSMVDASVGGKVGVNVAQGKNLIGAFHQPKLVLIDVNVLNTLSDKHFRCGLAECVKHGVIRDSELFSWISENLKDILAKKPETLIELVARNVQIKADVVMADEKELGQRAHLNFGHTFAHAIEATSGYGEIEHGEAVAIGMVAAARLAEKIGLYQPEAPISEQIVNLLMRIGLPVEADMVQTETLMDAMKLDKKVASGAIRFILPVQMGEVTIKDDISDSDVKWAWQMVRM